MLLLALCLMKIVVRAFPTALRHATACTIWYCFFLLVLHFSQELFGCVLWRVRSATGEKGEKAYRLTDSILLSCTGIG